MASEDEKDITIAEEIIEYCLETVKSDLDDRVGKCMEKIAVIKGNLKDRTIFNDPIHGSIKLNSLEQAMINTPEFFRLKDIKQLGGVVHVYPGATHTRFEHSLGVCYIAGELVRHLREQLESQREEVQTERGRKRKKTQKKLQPLQKKRRKLNSSKWLESMKEPLCHQDECCIRVAALCHDLGHGPFSHLFGKIVKIIEPEMKRHEELSKLIFKKILLDHPLVLANFIVHGLRKTHVEIIESMIDPDVEEIKEKIETIEIEGKSFKPIFLYEVVANKTSGMDVDKWDYFARDCHYLGLTNEFDWRRCMELSEIVLDRDNRELHIGFRSKEVNNIYGMFRTRSILHQKAYQHPVTNGIEMMIKDILIAVKDVKMIGCGSDGPISWMDAVKNVLSRKADLAGYIMLTDTILDCIMHHRIVTTHGKTRVLEKGLEKAQKLIKGIMSRDESVMYKCKRKKSYPLLAWPHERSDHYGYGEAAKKEIEKQKDLKAKKESFHKEFAANERMEIECVPIQFASEKKDDPDPLKDMYFFSRDDDQEFCFHKTTILRNNHDTEDRVSKLNLPQAFLEYRVRLYSKTKDNTEEELDHFFDRVKKYFD